MRTKIAALTGRLLTLLSPGTPRLDSRLLSKYVARFIDESDRYLDIALCDGTPRYILDIAYVRARAARFSECFVGVHPNARIYYAVKSNSHPLMMQAVTDAGLGLDVSSGLELKTALSTTCHSIVFSGPGKTIDELRLAVGHSDRVTVLMDSIGELERLDQICREEATSVKAGVRLTTDDSGIWRKFGIALSHLPHFFASAENSEYVNLCGLQFHLSWNMTGAPYANYLRRLGAVLENLTPKQRSSIEFIDIGGGFWPETGEWLQAAATVRGRVQTILGHDVDNADEHYLEPADELEKMTAGIKSALTDYIPSEMSFTLCAEPGRWLSNGAMHILLKVADRKSDDLVITDGGTNCIGWDRFESDYCPIINLTRPSLAERRCLICGSLCTPHDIWGYSFFGEDIQEGDILLVPDQGAYTYSLRQEFIKPIPGVSIIQSNDNLSVDRKYNEIFHISNQSGNH